MSGKVAISNNQCSYVSCTSCMIIILYLSGSLWSFSYYIFSEENVVFVRNNSFVSFTSVLSFCFSKAFNRTPLVFRSSSFRKLIESHHIPIVQKMTYGSKTCSMIKQNFAAKYVTTASLRMNKASQTCPTSESFF